MGDDTEHGFGVPGFVYGGKTYTHLNMSSNGYMTAGFDTATSSANTSLPDLAAPNGVLAPFWTDLRPDLAGALRKATLTDGLNQWVVLDWDGVRNAGDATTNSFEIWLGINGIEDISFAYGAVGAGSGGLLTIGAENEFGNVGATYHLNGVGSVVTTGTTLRVTSTGDPNLVPEPGTLWSLVGGLAALALGRLARRSNCRG